MKKKYKVIATAVAAAGAIGYLGNAAMANESPRESMRNEGISSFNEALSGFSAACSSIENRDMATPADAKAFFSTTMFDFQTGVCADNNVE